MNRFEVIVVDSEARERVSIIAKDWPDLMKRMETAFSYGFAVYVDCHGEEDE